MCWAYRENLWFDSLHSPSSSLSAGLPSAESSMKDPDEVIVSGSGLGLTFPIAATHHHYQKLESREGEVPGRQLVAVAVFTCMLLPWRMGLRGSVPAATVSFY